MAGWRRRSRTRRQRGASRAETSRWTYAAAKGPARWLRGAEEQEGTGVVVSAHEREGEGLKLATRGGVNGSRLKFLSKLIRRPISQKSPQALNLRYERIAMD